MNFATLGLAATIALATSSFAFAQQTMQLKDLDADRINPTQITVEFEYDGSACENVGPAVIGDLVDGTLAVSFPVQQTAEVCTQQIVENEVEQTIAAEAIISRIDVTLTGADGAVIATGTTNVDPD